MNELPIETVNQDAFLPFGDIIEKTNSNKKLTINQGTTIRHSEISKFCLLYTSPSPRDATLSRMPSSA